MDDYSINLRPFFEIPARWWRFIVATTAGLVILSLIYNLLPFTVPDVYRATSSVAIVKSRTEVSFDSAVRTVTEDDLLAGLEGNLNDVVQQNNDNRRQTLVELVNNGTIAERVIDQLQDELPSDDLRTGRLLGYVDATLADNGSSDLIQIRVTHPDPVIAARIANVWAAEYETLVNDIYGRPASTTDTVQGDVQRTKQIYDDAQEALVQAISESRVSQAQREIDEKQRILAVLQDARQRAISTTINFQVDLDAELYTAYLNAQSANRLLAFNSEQERKRTLIEAYIDTQTRAQVDTYRQQIADRQRVLEDAYTRKATLERLLERARTLQQQAQQGGDASSAALAVALLKMDVAGVLGRTDIAELNLTDPAELAPADLVADTTALVTALEAQLAATEQQISDQSETLISDTGIELFEPPSETELTAAIRQRYPELFEPGELAQLSEDVLEDNALQQAALQIADDLLQLRDRQGLLSFTSVDTPLNDAINALEQEIRTLQAQLERDQANVADLRRARDLAFEAYSTLSRKAAEISVADQIPGTEVRFASEATVPVSPANRTERAFNIILAVLLGLMLGLVGAVVLEFATPGSLPRRIVGGADAPWNRAWRWLTKPSPAIPAQRDKAAARRTTQQAPATDAAPPTDPPQATSNRD